MDNRGTPCAVPCFCMPSTLPYRDLKESTPVRNSMRGAALLVGKHEEEPIEDCAHSYGGGCSITYPGAVHTSTVGECSTTYPSAVHTSTG